MSDQTQTQSDYKKTLNLPKTVFPMKANLVQNEPASIKRWAQAALYEQICQARAGADPYVFHDGPPYANGSIHLGHLLNKVLKDFVVRSRNMMGRSCPFVPGWDCHGLPIEHKVMQDLGEKAKDMNAIQIRRKCRSSAEKFVKLQKTQMQRLLTLADYDEPYLTMNPKYEAAVLEVFADLVDRDVVYRGLKPVHWSIENRTALAEAELEYFDREDTSVYVHFKLDNVPEQLDVPADRVAHLLIWTTTPWTLPANLAVAVHERYEYGLYEIGDKLAIVATELAGKVLAAPGNEAGDPLTTFSGAELCGATYLHPFIEDGKSRRVVGADYVTLEDGTGLVHTAPGHGVDDYQTGLREKLDIYCPVRDDGTFDDTVPDWLRGHVVWDANQLVIDKLRDCGHLFHDEVFTHSYPHDWRGKTPVIFRATEQWFVAVDKHVDKWHRSLRALALEQTEQIEFYPQWGRNRLRGMIESRPDWCLSRQRSWGLPIPAFYPADGEGQPLLTAASVRAVAKKIREHGSDYWFTASPDELLADYDLASDPKAPAWAQSPDNQITKSQDIFDVWFESGSSWHACICERFGKDAYPTDLYLEGSDQHRGWFQLSLLPALGVTGRAPFKRVLTHGFMVDRDGKKMSKSLGNTLEVEELLKNYGADVCRWWVSSLNADNDIKVDESYFQVAGEEYRKVRNTIRFLLSNLKDFDPKADRYAFRQADATSIDTWVLDELMELVDEVARGYEMFTFRRTHEALFNFCNDTMSSVYLAAVKDRLYCDHADSPRRRRSQTAIYDIADALIRMLAPIMPHTADEAWRALHGEDASSVHLATLPQPTEVATDPEWAAVLDARDGWLKTIEEARQKLGIDNPLDCGLHVLRSDELGRFDPVDLADLCGISRFHLVEDVAETGVIDLRNQPRCQRSWKRDTTVKQRSDGGLLSDRDAAAMGLA